MTVSCEISQLVDSNNSKEKPITVSFVERRHNQCAYLIGDHQCCGETVYRGTGSAAKRKTGRAAGVGKDCD